RYVKRIAQVSGLLAAQGRRRPCNYLLRRKGYAELRIPEGGVVGQIYDHRLIYLVNPGVLMLARKSERPPAIVKRLSVRSLICVVAVGVSFNVAGVISPAV